MQANVFSIDKSHQHFILARHSFVSIRSQLNIRALICVYNRIGRTQLGNYLFSDSKVSETIARKTDSLHVHVFGLRPVCTINFARDQSSAKLINFLDSRLDTQDSRLDTRNYRGSSIESRGSRDCQLTFEQYCMFNSPNKISMYSWFSCDIIIFEN